MKIGTYKEDIAKVIISSFFSPSHFIIFVVVMFSFSFPIDALLLCCKVVDVDSL